MNTQITKPRTINVVELTTRMSERSVAQAAVVGRDIAGGIHLNLTADAAKALVGILRRIDAMSAISTTQVNGYDRAFWGCIGRDLEQALHDGVVPPNPATYSCACGWVLTPEEYGHDTEAADRFLDEHARTVAHDMRWPITFGVRRPMTSLPEVTYRDPVRQVVVTGDVL